MFILATFVTDALRTLQLRGGPFDTGGEGLFFLRYHFVSDLIKSIHFFSAAKHKIIYFISFDSLHTILSS